MTNPTSNFNWQMPTASDLVTDLPADFETFGQAVDTTLADLKGGTSGQVLSKASNTDMDFTWVTSDDANAIQNSIMDNKGDLIAASAADTPAILPIGTNGQVLKVNTSTATGLEWAADSTGMSNPMTTTGDIIYSSSGSTPARLGIGSSGQALLVSGGVPAWGTVSAGSDWSLLGSAALTAASTITVSGISGKNKLLVIVQGASCTSSAQSITLRFNSNSSSIYNVYGTTWGTPSSYTPNALQSQGQAQSNIPLGDMSNSASSVVNGYLMLDGCNTSGVKAFTSAGTGSAAGSNSQYSYTLGGFFNSSSTISSVSVIAGVNFDAGNIYVYSSIN